MGVKKKTPPPNRSQSNVAAGKTKKNFTAAAEDAAKSAVETVTAQTEKTTTKVTPRRRRISFEAPDVPTVTSTPHTTTAARRAVTGGIIEAQKRRREEEEEEAKEEETVDPVQSEESESDSADDSDADDLSALAEESADDDDSDEDGWENPFEKSKREGTRLSYPAVRLRFLPAEFQEPQLFKFLSQFGARVLNCFCVRSRRTHQSKGIAYVQFDREDVLDTVVEECHGMALGGRAVQAHRVTLHRAMPTKEKISRRRQMAYVYKTRGAPLRRHDVRKKSPVAALIKYTRTEQANNAHLKRHGIDYEYHGFEEQLKSVPKELFIKKKRPNSGASSTTKDHSNAKPTNSREKTSGAKGSVKSVPVESTVVSAAEPKSRKKRTKVSA